MSSLNPFHLKQTEKKKTVNLVSTFIIQAYHIFAGNWVKVKKSSPKSLSANCRPTVGRQYTNCPSN